MNEYTEVKTRMDAGGFWSQYRNDSVGRAINYLYHICGLRIAESVTFDNFHKVLFYGKPFATIDWSPGYPLFTFTGENATIHTEKQTELLSDKTLDWSKA